LSRCSRMPSLHRRASRTPLSATAQGVILASSSAFLPTLCALRKTSIINCNHDVVNILVSGSKETRVLNYSYTKFRNAHVHVHTHPVGSTFLFNVAAQSSAHVLDTGSIRPRWRANLKSDARQPCVTQTDSAYRPRARAARETNRRVRRHPACSQRVLPIRRYPLCGWQSIHR